MYSTPSRSVLEPLSQSLINLTAGPANHLLHIDMFSMMPTIGYLNIITDYYLIH